MFSSIGKQSGESVEEKVGYGRKDLQEKKVLNLE